MNLSIGIMSRGSKDLIIFESDTLTGCNYKHIVAVVVVVVVVVVVIIIIILLFEKNLLLTY